jgi:hypothetical protein
MENMSEGTQFIDQIRGSIQLLIEQAERQPETANKASIEALLEHHSFTTNRGLTDYSDTFGGPFVDRLNDSKADLAWLDAGAGQAMAMREYLSSKAGMNCQVDLTAVTLKLEGEAEAHHDSGIRFLVKQRFEDIPLADFGRVNLITDYTGVLNYTECLDVVVAKYVQLIGPSGIAFVRMPFFITFIRAKDGQILSLVEWLSRIGGLSVNVDHVKHAFSFQTHGAAVNIPRLKLCSALSNHFLFRFFSEVDGN